MFALDWFRDLLQASTDAFQVQLEGSLCSTMPHSGYIRGQSENRDGDMDGDRETDRVRDRGMDRNWDADRDRDRNGGLELGRFGGSRLGSKASNMVGHRLH